MERPLLLPLLSIIAGALLAVLCSFRVSFSFIIPLLLLAGVSLFQRSRIPFSLSLFLLIAAWANLSIQPSLWPSFPSHHISRLAGDDKVTIEGVIDSRPELTEEGCRVYVRAEKVCRRDGYIPVVGRVLLYVGEGRTPLGTGDRIRFRSRLSLPRNFGLPGEFDYVRHLAFRNVFVTAYVKKQREVLLMRSHVAFPLKRGIDSLAAAVAASIERSAPPEEAAVLRALLLGEQGGVPRSLSDAYARSGVNHVLSISGFHLGIISLVLFQLLYRAASRSAFLLLHCNLRRFILVLTLPVMIGYLFLTGAAPATVRSVIMLAAFVLALVVERETDPLDSLLVAAFAILAMTPWALFDLSFQLSFLAMWGLIVLTPIMMEPFDRFQRPILRKCLLAFMASAAATAATMLPVAHNFHRVSLVGLLANFIVVPLLGYGAVVIGFAALPFVWAAPPVAESLFTAAAFLVWASDRIILLLARLPVITWLHPGRMELLFFFLFILFFTFLKGGWVRNLSSGSCAVSCALLLCLPQFGNRNDLVISCLSVGQGESILVSFPDNRKMLIDGGGNPFGASSGSGRNVGERLLGPALWSLGIDRVDFLVLTHPHPDHLQGLLFVAEHFPVGEFWETGRSGDSEEYLQLKRLLAERHIPVRTMWAGAKPERIGNVTIEPLGPATVAHDRGAEDINDGSLVFRLVYGGFSMLFTGDMGGAAEEKLLHLPGRLSSAVLKVPHHGSRHSGSEPFLRAVSPRIALISAGYRNGFHLPALETLLRLDRLGIETWRTDLQGTVTITCDGNGKWSVAAPFRQSD